MRVYGIVGVRGGEEIALCGGWLSWHAAHAEAERRTAGGVAGATWHVYVYAA